MELPVGLRGKGDVVDGACETSGIDGSEGDLATRARVGVLAQPEGKEGVRDEVLEERKGCEQRKPKEKRKRESSKGTWDMML